VSCAGFGGTGTFLEDRDRWRARIDPHAFAPGPDSLDRVKLEERRAGLSTTTKVWMGLATIYVVWGSTYLAIRVGLRTMPPMLMAGTRFLAAGGILYAWAIRRGNIVTDRPGRRQWAAAAIVGGLLFLGGNGGVTLAETRLPSGITALLIATMPLWMAVLSRLFLGARLPPLAVAGLVLGFAGTAVLVRPTGLQHLDLTGVAIALTAALCWASGSLAMTRVALPSRLSVSTAIQMLAGGAFMIVLGVARGELARVHPAQISLGAAAALAYLVVVGSLVGFSTYTWLLATTRTPLISTYAYVNPVVAVLLGWMFLNERLTAQTLAASSLIVVAVAMIVWARRTREPLSTEAPPGGPAPETG